MRPSAFTLDQLHALCGGRLGRHDVPCPLCGPARRDPRNQVRPLLRIWHEQPGFASFHCARCGEKGSAFARQETGSRPRLDPETVAAIRAEAEARDREEAARRLDKARWLWSRRQPLTGSIAEIYLHQARGLSGPFPAETLAFLPARGSHEPALIAAFGLPAESSPGDLVFPDAALRGVHLTRLRPDGLGKADVSPSKVMIGRSAGAPIVLGPFGEGSGLVIAEGIEDALSLSEATGLPAWAAGAASRLPALAEAVPDWMRHGGCVTVVADADDTGRANAAELAHRLDARGIHVEFVELSEISPVQAPTHGRAA